VRVESAEIESAGEVGFVNAGLPQGGLNHREARHRGVMVSRAAGFLGVLVLIYRQLVSSCCRRKEAPTGVPSGTVNVSAFRSRATGW